jgi:hypothetical protein
MVHPASRNVCLFLLSRRFLGRAGPSSRHYPLALPAPAVDGGGAAAEDQRGRDRADASLLLRGGQPAVGWVWCASITWISKLEEGSGWRQGSAPVSWGCWVEKAQGTACLGGRLVQQQRRVLWQEQARTSCFFGHPRLRPLQWFRNSWPGLCLRWCSFGRPDLIYFWAWVWAIDLS